MIEENTSLGCHLENSLLRDFPHGLIELLQVIRNFWYALNGAIACNNLIFHLFIPQAPLSKIFQ